jgi:iron complex transport system permease protein
MNDHDSTKRRLTVLAAMVGATLLAFVIHASLGTTLLFTPLETLRLILQGPHGEGTNHFVVWNLRLPRSVGCVLVGALLGGAGSGFQALFKNRLAEPYTVGTAAGAGVGGVVAILLGWDVALGGLGVPVLGFVSGLFTLGLVLLLARRRGVIETPTLLLSGVLVGSLMNAAQALALFKAGKDTNAVIQWMLGSVDGVTWARIPLPLVVLVIAGGLMVVDSRSLNALSVGEDTAARLGVNVRQLRNKVLLCGVAMSAAAVGAAGVVGFVGLVAPHLARRIIGVDWRFSLPGSLCVGAITVLVADGIGARLVAGLPLGIMTALVAAPFLLGMLGKRD